MGMFFSRSSGKHHYARNDHGSDYYKRSHSSHSGILGWIFGLLFSSKRGRHPSYHSGNDYHGKSQYRRRSKSWS